MGRTQTFDTNEVVRAARAVFGGGVCACGRIAARRGAERCGNGIPGYKTL